MPGVGRGLPTPHRRSWSFWQRRFKMMVRLTVMSEVSWLAGSNDGNPTLSSYVMVSSFLEAFTILVASPSSPSTDLNV